MLGISAAGSRSAIASLTPSERLYFCDRHVSNPFFSRGAQAPSPAASVSLAGKPVSGSFPFPNGKIPALCLGRGLNRRGIHRDSRPHAGRNVIALNVLAFGGGGLGPHH